MRTRNALRALVALTFASLALAGCAQRFPAPTLRPREPYIPPPATFILVAQWQRADWNPTDVLLTRSGILLVAEDSARVANYSSVPQAQGVPKRIHLYDFSGLTSPVHLGEGGNHYFVADASDLSVKEFDPDLVDTTGGGSVLNPVRSFRDTSWVRIHGLAADGGRNVYVLCDARVLINQPPNPPAIEVQSLIYRYRTSATGITSVRDTIAEQGTGIGTIQGARALAYLDGRVYVADTEKDWAQSLDADARSQGFFKVDGTEADAPGSLKSPLGVTADGNYFYVSDTGNRRVLRYSYDGSFDQIVNQTGADGLVAPASVSAGVTAGKLYLYVADPPTHRINVYKFQR